MAEEQYKRQIARKLWIKDILAGVYVKEEGMKPNYVLLADNTHAARVNLFGVVVSASADGLPTLVLDDGSGRITVRAFEPNAQLSAIQIGDAVSILGKPRKFGNEMYVLPEIVRKLPDLGWLEVRKHELARTPVVGMIVPAQETATEEVLDESFGLSETVLTAIRSLDEGPGANTDQVIEHVGARDAEKTIQYLLQNGDIFEISPGKLKVLE
jgi:hypothetical protein